MGSKMIEQTRSRTLSSVRLVPFISSLNMSTAECINKVEEYESKVPVEKQTDVPVKHFFGDDVYVRMITFKRGTIATGRVQKVRHVSILISGHMTLWTPDRGIHDVYGPAITEVLPGMKRAGYAHTDVLWACAYGVKDVDSYHQDELLDFLTFRYYGDYLNFINSKTIEMEA